LKKNSYNCSWISVTFSFVFTSPWEKNLHQFYSSLEMDMIWLSPPKLITQININAPNKKHKITQIFPFRRKYLYNSFLFLLMCLVSLSVSVYVSVYLTDISLRVWCVWAGVESFESFFFFCDRLQLTWLHFTCRLYGNVIL